MSIQQKRILGHYIVADSKICRGKPTFIGTRIMVSQVLKRVAKGMSWASIVAAWDGDVSKEAIAEAMSLAERVFSDLFQKASRDNTVDTNLLKEIHSQRM